MHMKYTAQFAAAFALSALFLGAQTPTATLVGRVTDSTRSAVPGASVTVTNTNTNAVRRVQTLNDGEYTISALDPGVYVVAINKSEFRQVRETGLPACWRRLAVRGADRENSAPHLWIPADPPMFFPLEGVFGLAILKVDAPLLDRRGCCWAARFCLRMREGRAVRARNARSSDDDRGGDLDRSRRPRSRSFGGRRGRSRRRRRRLRL